MTTPDGEQSAAAEYIWPYFFSLPAEIRLNVYRVHFSQDIQHASEVREGKLGFRFYDLLLANRQICKEARHIARRQHLAQLQDSQQTFCLYHKQVEVSHGSPTWSWVIGSLKAYHPKNLNAERIAALRLPILGFRIYKTQSPCAYFDKRMDGLEEFCCKLRTALDKEGGTRTLELHFSRQILDERHVTRYLGDMRGLLSPQSTYSVTIVDCNENRADRLRLLVRTIRYNANVRCAMPPPLLLGGSSQ